MTGAAHGKTTRREWSPRIWEGCEFFAWLRLLAKNRFAVDWPYVYIAFMVTLMSMWNTVLRHVQELLYGERIRRTRISQPPIFIIGHWRSGTTWLHELLIQDPQHQSPTTFQCLDPNHILLTERFFTRWLRFLLPSHRPMDNMAAGWEKPFEDEFALCNLGLPSPYLTIAFPNNRSAYPEYLDLEGLSGRELAKWKKTFYRFLQLLTFKDPRRLILKSPPHSCRIPVLLELFPGARFVHIVRDPYVVYPSTVRMWKALYQTHGFQRPAGAGLGEQVFSTYVHLYDKLEKDRRLIPDGHYYEVQYEDLRRSPKAVLRKLYHALDLGDFDLARPRIEAYLNSVDGYETNHYQLTPEERAEITRRWGPIIKRYGYDRAETPEVAAPVKARRPAAATH